MDKAIVMLIMAIMIAFGASTSTSADSCVVQNPCPVVGETNYNGTGSATPKIYVTVCFADREYGYITRPDGTNEWVVHMRYQRSGGFERIETEHNTQCRLQGIVPGTTRVAVYVTCLEYTGWVATSVITRADSGKTITMERVSGPEWSYIPPPA